MLDVLKHITTYSQELWVDVMTSRGGQNVMNVLKNRATYIKGIICRCYDKQRWEKQGKNVLDVLKNRSTYLQLLHISSCLTGGHNRKRM